MRNNGLGHLWDKGGQQGHLWDKDGQPGHPPNINKQWGHSQDNSGHGGVHSCIKDGWQVTPMIREEDVLTCGKRMDGVFTISINADVRGHPCNKREEGNPCNAGG